MFMGKKLKSVDNTSLDNAVIAKSNGAIAALARGCHHHHYCSVNYFNKLKHGFVRSCILPVTMQFEVGQTMLVEETTNAECQLTGRYLVCIIDNIGVNITGLMEGYCVVTLRLS
jgi:hypothetical protein